MIAAAATYGGSDDYADGECLTAHLPVIRNVYHLYLGTFLLVFQYIIVETVTEAILVSGSGRRKRPTNLLNRCTTPRPSP